MGREFFPHVLSSIRLFPCCYGCTAEDRDLRTVLIRRLIQPQIPVLSVWKLDGGFPPPPLLSGMRGTRAESFHVPCATFDWCSFLEILLFPRRKGLPGSKSALFSSFVFI